MKVRDLVEILSEGSRSGRDWEGTFEIWSGLAVKIRDLVEIGREMRNPSGDPQLLI